MVWWGTILHNMKQLAIIRGVKCGVGDRGRAWLSFSTHTTECITALQIVEWDDAKKVIEDADVSDIYKLEGKPCWVEVERNTMLFVGIAKI